MIFDLLTAASSYRFLGPNFVRAFEWLASVDPNTLPEGRTPIAGDDVFVVAFRNHTRPVEQIPWEAHRRYADIQYVVSGAEAMEWAPLDLVRPGDYVPEKDFLPLEADEAVARRFEVAEGHFALFLPSDAHRPGIVAGGGPGFKLVVKVRLPEGGENAAFEER